jgi:hypothetical protein
MYVLCVNVTINSNWVPVSRHRLVLLMEARIVLCEVRTESVHNMYITGSHKGLRTPNNGQRCRSVCAGGVYFRYRPLRKVG